MYADHEKFLLYADQMRTFLEIVANELSSSLGAKVRVGDIVQDDSDCGLTFRVRPLHRAHCDIVFRILDHTVMDQNRFHEDSNYGINGGFVILLTEEVHTRQKRPALSVIEPNMMGYSDNEAWERELKQIEGCGNKVVAAVLDWLQTVV